MDSLPMTLLRFLAPPVGFIFNSFAKGLFSLDRFNHHFRLNDGRYGGKQRLRHIGASVDIDTDKRPG